jgi:hypothetical protein
MLVFKRPGAENALNKHMTSLLSFDKNKGFTLETGQFVPSCKMIKVSYADVAVPRGGA